MRRIVVTLIFPVTMLFSPDRAAAQYCPRVERVSAIERRRTEIDANNIRTSLFNFGFSGRTGVGQGVPFEWPKYTGRDYIALSALFIGGEVMNAQGDTNRIVLVPAFRYAPSGADWNMNPVPQYRNPSSQQIARSDDPSTWPPVWIDKLQDPIDPGWPGSWNSFFGKNAFFNGTEFYYHYTDDNYDRFAFYPDSSDLTRRGLGIVVSERIMEFRDPLLEDDLLTISDITNTGQHMIRRAAVTMWIADLVGGDGDSQDDEPRYDLSRQVLHFNDHDGISPNPAFQGVHVGTPTFVFIQTPSNLGITNLRYLPAGSINFSQTPDIFFWSTFMVPGYFFNPLTIGPGDYDLFASVGFFSLQPCAPQRLITAWVFAEDSTDGNRKAQYMKSFVNGGYSTNGVHVAILAPVPGQVVSGQTSIRWSADSGRASLGVDILLSSDSGSSWNAMVTSEPNDGVFSWNTRSQGNGSNYVIRIVAYDNTGIGYQTMSGVFAISNTESAPKGDEPVEFSLSQNYPNPWNPTTTIRYGLPHASFVTLTVYNTLGQDVAQLVNERQQAGYHDVVFRGDGLASGVYFYRLDAGSYTSVKKLLMLK